MTLSALGLFALALFVNSGSPGPSIAALIARVLTQGLASVLPFLLAFWIGEALWLVAALLGLGFVAQQFYLAFSILKYAGVAYLIYLAYKMWTAPVATDAAVLPKPDSALRMFMAGMAVTLGNPKIMVFYLALLPSLIDIGSVSSLGMAELVGVAVAVLVTTDLAWALAASRARSWLRSPRAIRISNRVSAMDMGGAAVAVATR
jgi:threonine/homoserine/homoserine lactone efflux protein